MRKSGIRWIVFTAFIPMLMGFCIHSQGIKGKVVLDNNTSMPLKGGSKHLGRPYSTIVYIYEAATLNQLEAQEGNWAKGLKARLIKQLQSDQAGNFKCRLRPGQYTIVLAYRDGIYIPFFSGNDGVALIQVPKHQYKEIDLRITASSDF